jgi:transposase InsO family protein/transposase-like protein
MAKKVVSMDIRLRVALSSGELNVSRLCQELDISRETFYVWKRRYLAEGLSGLEARSRAPRHSPHRVDPVVEERIVALRKELNDFGADHGPSSIQYRLGREKIVRVPSEATIWRVLVRRGFIVPEPKKRPHASFRRFEAARPNELWQADHTEWTIKTGVVKILSFIDDHSRVLLDTSAHQEVTGEAAWAAFSRASQQWGLPLGQLTDNGMCFSGKIRGFEVLFEKNLRAAGVIPKTSRPYHPQTCGKVERFQQTMKKWLRKQPMAANLAELQTQLDTFTEYYNTDRPHRALDRQTPIEAWTTTPPAINLGTTIPAKAKHTTVKIDPSGHLCFNTYRFYISRKHVGQHATIHYNDTHVAIYIGTNLFRSQQLDPTRRIQPKPKP